MNDGYGMAGIAPRAWLLPVRVLDGTSGTVVQAASGIMWAVDQGAQVVLVPLTFGQAPQQLRDAVQYAIEHDVLLIAPSGNAGNPELLFPAAIPGCLAVSGTTNRDELSPSSNFGAGVDLAAPGHDVWSAWRNDGYMLRSGAAPATAFIAGVAALIRSYNPALTQAEVRQILVDAADDLGPTGPDVFFGAGRLNAERALATSPAPALRFEQIDPPPIRVVPGRRRTFVVRLVDGAEGLAEGSAMLAYREGGGPFQFDALADLGDRRFEAQLPATPCGSTIEYYLLAEGSGGTVVTSPWDAPATLFSAEAVVVEPVFTDDFEEDLGWKTEFFGMETKGQWVRVIPVGTTAQPAFDRSANEGAYCFVTGQHLGGGDGASDVDGGPVVLMSPVIPVDTPDALVSYARWFYWSGAETEDFLTIEASRDGGATWAIVERVSGTTNATWVIHEFRLGEFPELTGAALRLRFRTHDDPNDSLVEAAIDDVTVIALSCGGNPADLDGDGDADLADYERLARCLMGPGLEPDPQCLDADLTENNRVDLADFARFQANLTAPIG
jgi:hypothetical protein